MVEKESYNNGVDEVVDDEDDEYDEDVMRMYLLQSVMQILEVIVIKMVLTLRMTKMGIHVFREISYLAL